MSGSLDGGVLVRGVCVPLVQPSLVFVVDHFVKFWVQLKWDRWDDHTV